MSIIFIVVTLNYLRPAVSHRNPLQVSKFRHEFFQNLNCRSGRVIAIMHEIVWSFRSILLFFPWAVRRDHGHVETRSV